MELIDDNNTEIMDTLQLRSPEMTPGLDELFFKQVHLFQHCLKLKVLINQSLEQGYHNLAKARYNMGNNRVSMSQVPAEELSASVKVAAELVHDSDYYKHSLVREEEPTVEKSSDGGVHQRKAPADQTADEETSKAEDEEQKSEKLQKDPLRWFGVLVPQELRSAQSCFQKVLELSVRTVNLQNQLVAMGQELWAMAHCNPPGLEEEQ